MRLVVIDVVLAGLAEGPLYDGPGVLTLVGRDSMDFFLRPAGGRLGPLAESGSVLPVGECHEVYGERTGRARANFLRRKRQVAKLVRAAVSQEMDDEQRKFTTWDEYKGSIAALQGDPR